MKVVCVATSRNNWLNDWENSARQWNYDYQILGLGVEWKGFSTKQTLLLEFFERCDPSEVVVVVDAYDLIFAGPPEELQSKYNAFHTPIVVGGEDTCILNCHRHSCPVNNNDYKYVNGGCVVGTVDALAAVYAYALAHSPHDDQIGIAKYMDEHCDQVAVDGNQSIVANLRSSDNLECVGGNRFRHVKTGTMPVLVHMPFVYADFGKRCAKVKQHGIKHWEPPASLTYVTGYFSHLYKHMTNPAYRPLKYGLYGILVLILAICMYVFLN